MRAKRLTGPNEERFWPKVNRHGEVPVLRPDLGPCWEWTAARTQSRKGDVGYGIFRLGNATNVRAHRFAYEQIVGAIPEGMTLDHLCHKTWCVNPDHLEPVTHAENVARGHAGGRSWRSRTTHCPRGHAYTPENTRTYNGSRQCIACQNERRREAAARRRAGE